MKYLCFLALFLTLFATPLLAEDQGWSGAGEFGLVVARGNSETETVNARLTAQHDDNQWRHSFSLSGLYAQDSGETSANRYVGAAKSDYKFSERSYMYGALRHEADRLSGFEYQSTFSIGFGTRVFDTDTRFLSLEGGPGYRRAKSRGDGEIDNELIARGELSYRQNLTSNTEFGNRLLIETGDDNTLAENETSLTVKMNERLALKVALSLRHNSEVPVDTKKTDTLTTINLVYGF